MASLNYYNKAFEENPVGNYFVKWNWAAFLFAPLWLGYRKMYLAAIVTVAIPLIIAAIFPKTFFLPSPEITFNLSNLVALTLHFTLGFLGTSLYGKKWKKNQISHHAYTSLIGITLIIFLMFISFFPFAFIGLKTYINFFNSDSTYSQIRQNDSSIDNESNNY